MFKNENVRTLVVGDGVERLARSRTWSCPPQPTEEPTAKPTFTKFDVPELNEEQCAALNERAPQNLRIRPPVGWND